MQSEMNAMLSYANNARCTMLGNKIETGAFN